MASSRATSSRCVTKRQPTEQELADCLFAWTVAKHVKSNAIVYAKDGVTAGIGAGQMNRRDSSRIAALTREGGSRGQWLARAAHGRLGGRIGRLFPVCRRLARRGRSRRDRGHSAGRLDPRRGSDRCRRRGRAGDGLHRNAALPALDERRPPTSVAGQSPRPRPRAARAPRRLRIVNSSRSSGPKPLVHSTAKKATRIAGTPMTS